LPSPGFLFTGGAAAAACRHHCIVVSEREREKE